MRKKLLIALFSVVVLSLVIFSCQKIGTDNTQPNASGNLKATSNEENAAATNNNGTTGRVGPGGCTPTAVTLIAGQTINSGNVTVSNDNDNITVTYTTANGWYLTQTHLYAGDCELIPVNGPGNPMPGQFPYSSAHNYATSYTYTVPVSAITPGSCGCIAAHAVVVRLGATGNVIETQTGWGNGTRINPRGGNWGMKFDYCSCTP